MRSYTKPAVLLHEQVKFETLISCDPPNVAIDAFGKPICLRPDETWFPR
ncbi:hypothetical protein IDH44_25565 [Paenibacillus sp. IB182496]|uniref:Uncharacterized protein n=1 Tax=Paenibacillus sabuli TaxID=2772509 RepID=A0A927BX87_9BACL|nr:hypothetical protein [Paenibacillus sabuli]MBD2848561.1 hypothetical protein [Paenibacillus sabuli]